MDRSTEELPFQEKRKRTSLLKARFIKQVSRIKIKSEKWSPFQVFEKKKTQPSQSTFFFKTGISNQNKI